LAGIAVLYLILGCFFDSVTLLLLTVPFIAPGLQAAGFDMVWMGVYIIILEGIGLLTPPVGTNLFAVAGASRISVEEVIKGSIPYWFILLVVAALICVVPEIVTWLPSGMYR